MTRSLVSPPAPWALGLPYPQDTALSRSLLANALFSSFSGVVLLLAPMTVASMLGVTSAIPIRIVGAGLVAFGLMVGFLSARRPVLPQAALAVTAADAGWVAASLVAVLAWRDLMTGAGVGVVLGVAVVVALIGLSQLRGLVLFARNPDGRTGARSRFVLAGPVEGQPDTVWARLRSLDRIGEHYDALVRVDVQEVGGVTKRSCATVDGGRWTEEVVELDDGKRSLVLRFDTSTGRFPLPVTEMLGGWQVWPHGEGAFLVLWYELTLRGGLAGEVLAGLADPLLRRQLGPVFESLGARVAADDQERAEVSA